MIILEKNAFTIKTPMVRRGIMGWKLSQITDKNSVRNLCVYFNNF